MGVVKEFRKGEQTDIPPPYSMDAGAVEGSMMVADEQKYVAAETR